jgi:putative FmdB family regulatory protein
VPTYDYQCRSCGHTIEVIHSMLEEGPATCERCGGGLRRVLYPAGIIFKGAGFYKTDSRSAGAAKAATSTGAKPGSDNAAPAAGADSSGTGGGSIPPAPDAAKGTETKKESAGA